MYLCHPLFILNLPIQLKLSITQIILYPISIFYGVVTSVRNWLFDKKILSSTAFSIPVISVGNLSVGGTGKTPHTEFILELLQNDRKVALLSRGYKRETKGFVLADSTADALKLGDEPYQIYLKFPTITVAVDEKRVHGVQQLLEINPDLETIVLDDAFQHRYIKSGLSILLTDYSHLYSRDLLLPAGRLREFNSGSERANIIVVTKCPENMLAEEFKSIEKELNPTAQQEIYFSHYVYKELIPVFPALENEHWTFNRVKNKDITILLVAGIVYPQSIVAQLEKYTPNVETIFYEDHHSFLMQDLLDIMRRFDEIKMANKILLVTEKDAARLVTHQFFPERLKSITYALPIKVQIINNQENIFIQKIQNYVAENTRNS